MREGGSERGGGRNIDVEENGCAVLQNRPSVLVCLERVVKDAAAGAQYPLAEPDCGAQARCEVVLIGTETLGDGQRRTGVCRRRTKHVVTQSVSDGDVLERLPGVLPVETGG